MLVKSKDFIHFSTIPYFNFSSIWSHIKQRAKDPILGLVDEFNKDPCPNKVNLTVGAYRDENGKPYVLHCVREAEKLYSKLKANHEYLPIGGIPSFVKHSLEFAYSKDCPLIKQGKICAVQALSGTGAIRIGFEFLNLFYQGNKCIYLPKPSWPNHANICNRVGIKQGQYRYYDYKNKCVDFNGLIEDIEQAPKKSIILFHACAHNPTGMDLTKDQWKDVAEIIKAKNHLPFMDMAYQGFASGDPVNDSYAVRLFANQGLNVVLSQSYAKNLGLYGQRVGCLSFVCKSEKEVAAMKSQLNFICRSSYSNPPKYGATITDTIFSSKILTNQWMEELKKMSGRIMKMRELLSKGLKENGSELDWSHITKQIGMFAFTGLNKEQVKKLREQYHIYLVASGRISVAGLNTHNVEYVAKAFHEVTKF